MFKRRNSKKGITPLIATFLLISFAIALGVVIMNFGRAQVDSEAVCPVEIELMFSEVAGERELCIDLEKNDIYFAIENGVNVEIEKVIVNVIGSKRAESYDLTDAQMGRAGNYLTHIGYNEELSGEIKQMKVIPVIVPNEDEEICTEQALVTEELREC
ncbi:MAG: hypothetical protein ABIG93_00805 [archaeon]|nr:hypothetical protein [Nanoarchaeota archaeon]